MTDPRHTSEMDQLLASIRDLAHLHARYYMGLLEGGMDQREALSLTAAVAEAQLGTNTNEREDWE